MAYIDTQVFLAGLSGPVIGGVGGGLGTAALATTADTTIDVNVSTGSDTTGDGTAAKPFASIMRAVDAVPHIRRHIITIRVFAGTYAETIRDGGMYTDNGTLSGGRVIIEGQDWTTPVLGSGSITSGVLGAAPATGCTRTVAGAAWTVDELKGYMARITSGAQSGTYYSIGANAAGSLDIANTNANLDAATFDIVQSAVIITKSPGAFASAIISNAGSLFGTTFQIKRVRLQPSTFYGVYATTGACQVLETNISTHTATGVQLGNVAAYVSVSRSYIQSSGAAMGVAGSDVSNLTVGGTFLDGGVRGIQAFTVVRMSTNSAGHCVIQNTTAQAMDFKSGPTLCDSFSVQKFILRNNVIGLRIQGNARFLLQFAEISGNSSHGIQMLANEYCTSHCSIHAFSCKITGNGGDGIRMETPHNNLMFGGAGADISGNTGFGLLIGGQPASYVAASHNTANFDASVTMSGNVAGDITHDDGASVNTLAAVRAAGFILAYEGSVTLSGGSATVPHTAVKAGSKIFLTRATSGGAAGVMSVIAIVPGVSFTIDSSVGGDSATVNWSFGTGLLNRVGAPP